MSLQINIPRERIADFCRKHDIRKLSVFGSLLHGDIRVDSDIDILVEFEPDHVPGMFDIVRLEQELSAMLGRKVDLRTPEDLSRYFRAQVLEEAEVQYANG
ncbi:nucleotidyltransferase family protein [Desulfatirhabdium butyrativorans]|uniref:nucleotidyltransferase family protein n=1 Tax=Desulfatirhabdium butyrativorans TaxID=340467 RepID=UPI00041C59FE|nr:nucleotidyltransferase [Desulfatirhabdium butyrativorans]